METKVYKYFAFISYQRNDEEIARWLHHQLEHYRLPVNICEARPDLPKELRPLFLDEAELSGGNLSEAINRALGDSKHLIVLCSPNSAKSPWVNKEVLAFIQSGRTENIIPLIIDGIPYSENPETECFPEALINLHQTDSERLGINMQNGQEIASVKLIAQMLGVSFDELWQRYEREKQEERLRLINEKRRLQRLESRYLAEKAEDAIRNGDTYTACMLALRALPTDISNPEDRPYIPEAEAVLRKAVSSLTTVMKGHTRAVYSTALSPDGKQMISASGDGTAIIWDLDSGVKIQTLSVHSDQVMSACFSHDGKHILTASVDGTTKITDIKSGEVTRSMEHYCKVYRATYSPCGNYIASGAEDGSICIWEVETGDLHRKLTGHEKWVGSVQYSNCGKQILSASGDGTVKLWNISDETCIKTFDEVHSGPINSIEFSKDDKTVLSSSDDKTIKIWDANSGEVLQTITGHESIIEHAEYSPDGKFIISSSWDKTIKIWDAKTGNLIRTYKGHFNNTSFARFSKDGRFIIAASWDSEIKLLDFYPSIDKFILDDGNEGETIKCLAFCNNGKNILASSGGKAIKLWDIESRTALLTYTGHTGNVTHIAISPDGKQFASASEDRTIRLWDINKPEAISTFRGHSKGVLYVEFSPDGTRLISASLDHSVIIWDISKATAVKTISGGSDIIYKVFHDQEYKEIIATTSQQAIIIDAEDFTIKKRIKVNSDEDILNPHICNLHNRKMILSNGAGNSLAIWDMDRTATVRTLPNKFDSNIHFAAFTDDGKQILSTAWYGDVKVIDTETGEDIWAFKSGHATMACLAFSPDRSLLAGACADGSIHIYPYRHLQALINETRERFRNRELSEETKRRLYLD